MKAIPESSKSEKLWEQHKSVYTFYPKYGTILKKEFTEPEREAIARYTAGGHGEINSMLREGKNPKSEQLSRALKKLPKYEGVLYRVMVFHESDVKNAKSVFESVKGRYKKGATATIRGFMSTTVNFQFIEHWNYGYNIVMEIRAIGEHGRIVGQLHAIDRPPKPCERGGVREKEVIFPPGTKFYVESTETRVVAGHKRWYIKMRELKSGG